MRATKHVACLFACLQMVACGDSRPAAGTSSASPTGRATTTRTDERTVEVSESTTPIGTRPGRADRDPVTEADLVPTRIPAFEIDVAPYPNRPDAEPRTNVTRARAAALCEAEGKRLCHELEWEAACRAGAVPRMGSELAEWTSGPATRFADGGAGITRGGRADAARGEDRCGVRHATSTETSSNELGFRCCGGEAPELAYPTETTGAPFVERSITTEEARRALASVPELAAHAATFTLFTEADVGQVFVRGAVTPEAVGVRKPVRGALRFTPRPYDESLILVGRAGPSSLIAVLYPAGGGYVHGASMVLENDPVSVLVTYAASNTTAAQWTSCFDCPGEGGTIELRPDGRIVVVQR